ncbi:MAG: FAD-dependent oxidoreductase, partial [Deltaproteobacteria bacterium]|nr:FAD-dependent oxidoreductase [Deltaproteobacteria bacterium]
DFARLAIGFASLPTYHPDPGILSAAFVQERIARSSQWRPVWYINGGWINLVDRLAIHAEKLGVEIVTRSKLSRLPDGPCIVATDLAAAAKLLGEPELDWPSPDNALLDVALEKRWGDPTAVLDVDDHAYISCYSAGDASVAPRGESLLQGVTGIHPGEEPEAARERVYALLDAGRNQRSRRPQRPARDQLARPARDRPRSRSLVDRRSRRRTRDSGRDVFRERTYGSRPRAGQAALVVVARLRRSRADRGAGIRPLEIH